MITQITLGLKPFRPPCGVSRLYGPDIKQKPPKIPPGTNMILKAQENRATVLKFICLRKSSATKLAKLSGLARSTISNMTDSLLSDGLIVCDKSTWPWQYSATAKGKSA
jgi:predicted transcriptional regulator